MKIPLGYEKMIRMEAMAEDAQLSAATRKRAQTAALLLRKIIEHVPTDG